MKFKLLSTLVVAAGVAVLAFAAAPSIYGQHAARDDSDPYRELSILAGRGSQIGASVRDADRSDHNEGVVVDDVRPDSPAERAGLKRSDVIVEFDGEHVRSARQFTRLVQETSPGRTVSATVVRDGQRKTIEITPSEGAGLRLNDEMIRDRITEAGRMVERLQPYAFDFDLQGLSGYGPRNRLGITVVNLTTQLATYFGAKEGVLVTSVADNSPASRAGLKAGDVITSFGGDHVRETGDLLHALHRADEAASVSLGIVRDKKEITVTATLEPPRR